MLKLKLQYFGHLMRRIDSLEKTLMLGKTEDRRRRGGQRMRWLDGITNSWTWVWAGSGSWWWTGRPGMPQSTGSQRVWHDWMTELNWRGWREKNLKRKLKSRGEHSWRRTGKWNGNVEGTCTEDPVNQSASYYYLSLFVKGCQWLTTKKEILNGTCISCDYNTSYDFHLSLTLIRKSCTNDSCKEIFWFERPTLPWVEPKEGCNLIFDDFGNSTKI